LGIYSTYEAFHELSAAFSHGETVPSNLIVVYLISSLDEFLLGIILIIIALGIYELFISEIDTLKGEDIPYPNWLTFHSLDDLKAVLTKVIIIILMVYFFKSAVVLHFDTPISLLYLSIGIVLIAVANYLSHKQRLLSKTAYLRTQNHLSCHHSNQQPLIGQNSPLYGLLIQAPDKAIFAFHCCKNSAIFSCFLLLLQFHFYFCL